MMGENPVAFLNGIFSLNKVDIYIVENSTFSRNKFFLKSRIYFE